MSLSYFEKMGVGDLQVFLRQTEHVTIQACLTYHGTWAVLWNADSRFQFDGKKTAYGLVRSGDFIDVYGGAVNESLAWEPSNFLGSLTVQNARDLLRQHGLILP